MIYMAVMMIVLMFGHPAAALRQLCGVNISGLGFFGLCLPFLVHLTFIFDDDFESKHKATAKILEVVTGYLS